MIGLTIIHRISSRRMRDWQRESAADSEWLLGILMNGEFGNSFLLLLDSFLPCTEYCWFGNKRPHLNSESPQQMFKDKVEEGEDTTEMQSLGCKNYDAILK